MQISSAFIISLISAVLATSQPQQIFDMRNQPIPSRSGSSGGGQCQQIVMLFPSGAKQDQKFVKPTPTPTTPLVPTPTTLSIPLHMPPPPHVPEYITYQQPMAAPIRVAAPVVRVTDPAIRIATAPAQENFATIPPVTMPPQPRPAPVAVAAPVPVTQMSMMEMPQDPRMMALNQAINLGTSLVTKIIDAIEKRRQERLAAKAQIEQTQTSA